MKHIRRAFLLSMLAVASACGSGGGSDGDGGGSSPPPGPPPPPPGPQITSPALTLPAATRTIAVAPITFTGTGTGTHVWTVTGGSLPTGITLTTAGLYSGTPTFTGTYTFTVTLTADNGTDSDVFTQVVLPSRPEVEPNEDSTEATFLPDQMAGTGVLGSDDVDFWSFSADADDVIEVAVYATRRDFNSWQTNIAFPRISLLDTDGLTFLAGIDYFEGASTGWYQGPYSVACDLDIARFLIPATGTYYIRLDQYFAATPGGAYAVRVNTLNVGVMQLEVESNNNTTDATAIVEGTIRATRTDGDDDYYSFSVAGPTLVYVEASAYRDGLHDNGGFPDDDYVDPLIELIGTDEITVLNSNDDVFIYDSAIHYLIVNAGIYYLRVTESTFPSLGDGPYYLTFTLTDVGNGTETENNDDPSVANPIAYGDIVSGTVELGVDDYDFFSFSGTAGDMVRIFWFEDGTHETAADITDILFTTDSDYLLQAVDYFAPDRMNCVRAILPSTGTFYVGAFAIGTSEYTFRLELVRSAQIESESNNSRAAADVIPFSGAVAGVILDALDVDVFSFTAIQGEVINFSIHAAVGSMAVATGWGYLSHNGFGSLLLPDLEILDSTGAVIASTPYEGANFSGESMTNGLATSGITLVAPTAGTFYVRVSSNDNTGSVDHIYLLEID